MKRGMSESDRKLLSDTKAAVDRLLERQTMRFVTRDEVRSIIGRLEKVEAFGGGLRLHHALHDRKLSKIEDELWPEQEPARSWTWKGAAKVAALMTASVAIGSGLGLGGMMIRRML